MVAGTEQALHHQSSSHGIKQTKVLWDTTLLGKTERNIELITEQWRSINKTLCVISFNLYLLVYAFCLLNAIFLYLCVCCASALVCTSYQCVEIVADQGAIVDDISFEDDKEEEESQHHVTEVTEDVVECTIKDS